MQTIAVASIPMSQAFATFTLAMCLCGRMTIGLGPLAPVVHLLPKTLLGGGGVYAVGIFPHCPTYPGVGGEFGIGKFWSGEIRHNKILGCTVRMRRAVNVRHAGAKSAINATEI